MFAGVLWADGGGRPRDLVAPEQLLAALTPRRAADASGFRSDGPMLVVHAAHRGDRQSNTAALPSLDAGSGRCVAFWGRLDNRDGLIQELGVASSTSDHALVEAAFDRWEASCPARLTGDFAGAICDPHRRRVLLFRDRLGVKPLYYCVDGSLLIFATTAAIFPLLRGRAPAADVDWMAELLAGVDSNNSATGWCGVAKLAPGHYLDFDRRGARLRRYHSWRDDPPWTTVHDPTWVETYRGQLEEAVRCRMRGADRMGSESSGGLDSSTVTSYLARFLGEPGDRLCALGFALQDLEAGYIAETSRHAKIAHNYVVTTGLRLDDAGIARGLATVGYPERMGDAVGHIRFYQECARRGIATLFSGFGGDEAVSNSGQLLGRELRDHCAYRELWRYQRGTSVTKPLRMGKALVSGQRWGGGHRSLWAAMEARWPHQLVRADVVDRLDLRARYRRQAAFDGPYRRINDFIVDNRLGPIVARRLETCTLLASTFGVEYRWPLLDDRLIQQYLSTPSIEKANGTMGRYLHRRAVEGVVPPRIVWKQDKVMSVSPSPPPALAVPHDWVRREARRQRAHLHPAVSEVIDLRRLDAQIAAAGGPLDGPARFQFARNVDHLRWLNQWLSGRPPP